MEKPRAMFKNKFPLLSEKHPHNLYWENNYFRLEEAVEGELQKRVCDLNVPIPACIDCAGIENE